ncbi:hypothetical protein AUP68_10085 [Ilyonectria robusta]
MQGQPGMDSEMPPAQIVYRQPNNLNPMGNQGIGQMNMAGQMTAQPGAPGNAGQQMQVPMVPQNPRAIAMMDSMDLPPQVLAQLGQVPAELKKWGALKMWLGQKNIPQQVRNQLSTIQQKQFQLLLQERNYVLPQQQQQQTQPPQQPPQQVQNPNINPDIWTPDGPIPNAQQDIQRPVPNIPAHVLQVSPQELLHVRTQRPNLANVPDEQLRMMIMQLKRQSWITQQRQRRSQQAQGQTIQPPGLRLDVPKNNRDKHKSRLTSIRRDKSSVVGRSHIKSTSRTLQVNGTPKSRPPKNTQQASRISVPLSQLIEPSKKNVSQHVVYTISQDYTDLERVRKSRLCALTSSSACKDSGYKF